MPNLRIKQHSSDFAFIDQYAAVGGVPHTKLARNPFSPPSAASSSNFDTFLAFPFSATASGLQNVNEVQMSSNLRGLNPFKQNSEPINHHLIAGGGVDG